MISYVFSVLDVKAEFYMPTQTAPTMAMAVRMFLEAALDERSQINKYPDDFVLFELGKFNDANASFDMLESKVSLGTARELLAAVPTRIALPVQPLPALVPAPDVKKIVKRVASRKKGKS